MIRGLRLPTGEDLIADIEVSSDSYVVKNPIQVGLQQNNNGFGLVMLPFLPFAKEKTFTLPQSNVVFLFEPETDLRNEYSKITGSILIPDIEKPKLTLLT
jgi:hypothetical protein